MRQLSDWNKFTMKVKQENPDMRNFQRCISTCRKNEKKRRN